MKQTISLTGEPERSAREARFAPGRWRVSITAWRAAGVAAVLTLVVGGALLMRGRVPAFSSAVRGPSPHHSTVPPDGVGLAVPPPELTWSDPEPGEAYRFVLYDRESTAVWRSPSVSEATIVIPPAVRSQLVAGGQYYWRVFLIRGIERRQSPLFAFRLAPS